MKKEATEQKINYLRITSSNHFKIMDHMYLALVNDNFQKSLGILEEKAFGNFFQLFFNKIFPIKSNSDLYFQNMFLVERYFSHSHMKEMNDISESMNYMLNYDFNGEFSLNQEIIEHIGNILLFGFEKIKTKFKLYLIKSYADLKEKLENVRFNQIDLLNEYYNQELFQKNGKVDLNNTNKDIPKYVYQKEPFVDSDGNVLGQENKYLPNELILLLNKVQFIKTLSFNTENIFTDVNNINKVNLETIKYLIILINIQWILPNILVVNFNLSNIKLSNSLIDIMSLKLSQEMKEKNIYEGTTYYSFNDLIKSNNYDLIIKTNNSNKNAYISHQIRKNKNEISELNLTLEMESSDEEEYTIKENDKKEVLNADNNSNITNNTITNIANNTITNITNSIINNSIINNINNFIERRKQKKKDKIKELYTNYLNKYNKELDLIIITTYYIRILDKLHALNIRCPDSFSSEIRECYNNINNTKEINFLNLLVNVDHLNILEIEFNSLDFINFQKILALIKSNSNLSSLKLIFFSYDKFYSPGGIFKVLTDINDPKLNIDSLSNTRNFENSAVNQLFLDKFQKNLEILGILLRNRSKSLNELSLLFNIPTLLINNDYYILSLIKFIINIFIFLCLDKNQIKIIKLIAPLINLDSRKISFLNDFFRKIKPDSLHGLHTLFLQFNFYKMTNIANLISSNLHSLNIGNFDIDTFSSFVNKVTFDVFIIESKLVNFKIALNKNIIDYDDEIKKNILLLLTKYPKNLLNLEIITNIKINYEQLHELAINSKKSYLNKIVITFNEESENVIQEIIKKDLTYAVAMNKENEQNLKNLAKILIQKLNKNPEDKNKNIELRKKVFNNIKIMTFDKKDVRFECI